MSNITIGRYPDITAGWSGWIEGTDTVGRSWITFLDATGLPALVWLDRDPTGAVIGDPINLLSA